MSHARNDDTSKERLRERKTRREKVPCHLTYMICLLFFLAIVWIFCVEYSRAVSNLISNETLLIQLK